MVKFARDALYSLEMHTPTEEDIQNKIIAPLQGMWMNLARRSLNTGE